MAKNIENVLALLGGLDCGACGYPTCEECAKAIVEGEVDGGACVMIDEEAQESINSL
jgi:Na+-translocating ferredoxin:NAD+ oxidoreductase RNF subunit RnfB